MNEKGAKKANAKKQRLDTDTLSILPYENLDDIFSIYTQKKVLLVLDPHSPNYSFFLSLFSRLHDRFVTFEKYVLDYEHIGFNKDYRNLKSLAKKEKFDFYVGDGVGATFLMDMKVGGMMVVNPYINKEAFDMLSRKLNMKEEYYPFLDCFFLKNGKIDYQEFDTDTLQSYPIIYFDNSIYNGKFLKDNVYFYFTIKNVHLKRSKAYQKEFIEELLHQIRYEVFSKAETKESKKTNGIDFVRNENWKADWLPFILYDHHCNPDFFYRLILHKLELMKTLFSDRQLGPRNPYTFRRVKKELETAYLLFEPTIYSYDYIQDIDALEKGFASGIVVYYKNGSPVFYWDKGDCSTSLYAPGAKLTDAEIWKTIQNRYRSRDDFTITEYQENPDFDKLLSLKQKDIIEEDKVRESRAKKIRMTAFEYIVEHSDEWSN